MCPVMAAAGLQCCYCCRFEIQQMVVALQGLASGIAYMHHLNMVDQDLHAGNVLLSQDGQALIKTDLGSAVWSETDGQPTFLRRCL